METISWDKKTFKSKPINSLQLKTYSFIQFKKAERQEPNRILIKINKY